MPHASDAANSLCSLAMELTGPFLVADLLAAGFDRWLVLKILLAPARLD